MKANQVESSSVGGEKVFVFGICDKKGSECLGEDNEGRFVALVKRERKLSKRKEKI